MPRTENVLPLLRKLGLDDHEVIPALCSALNEGGSRRIAKRTYELGFGDHRIAEVKFNEKLALSSVVIPTDRWNKALPIIEGALRDEQSRVARTTLFSYRKVNGFACVPDWLQLRPVSCELKDATPYQILAVYVPAGIPWPFAVEVVFRHSQLLFLEAHRRSRAVQEAVWLLAAFLDTPIFGLSSAHTWALIDGSYNLVRCGMGLGFESASDLAFSETEDLPRLSPVDTQRYFSELGVTTREFRVPDLGSLYAKYAALSHKNRFRFLRSCASLYAASDPNLNESQRVVSLVTAIEPLLAASERCGACGSHTGITRQFRYFLDHYVNPPPEVRDLYEGIYAARSKIVHGGWRFEVDEPFLGLQPQGEFVPLVAWGAAKQGVVNWLLANSHE